MVGTDLMYGLLYSKSHHVDRSSFLLLTKRRPHHLLLPSLPSSREGFSEASKAACRLRTQVRKGEDLARPQRGQRDLPRQLSPEHPQGKYGYKPFMFSYSRSSPVCARLRHSSYSYTYTAYTPMENSTLPKGALVSRRPHIYFSIALSFAGCAALRVVCCSTGRRCCSLVCGGSMPLVSRAVKFYPRGFDFAIDGV